MCPVISNVMVVGENAKFLAAIITFKAEVDPGTGVPSKKLTPEAKVFFKRELNLDFTTTDEAISNEKVLKLVHSAIE